MSTSDQTSTRRLTASVISISWIPSEAMSGPLRVPMDLGVGHYDLPPPDHIEPDDLETLRGEDRFRFANHLEAWIEVEDGLIVETGYSGGGLVGSTSLQLGASVTVPGVGFPVIQEFPAVDGNKARFVQIAGGRTGAPLPHRIDRPPYLRMTAPTAWTTLALTLAADGSAEFELVGASPFPRHWVYGPDGTLAAKSGVIDFAEWTRVHDHDHSPWHDFERPVVTTAAESQIERELSRVFMSSTRPRMLTCKEGSNLIEQGQRGQTIYLILDGVLRVKVDGEEVAELGPGAIVGERAILETGRATATVTAVTPVRAALVPADAFDRSELENVAAGHRREEI